MNLKAAPLQSTQSGVTLVELMVTITIVGILLGMGVSGYKYVTKSNRSSGEINALLGDMQFARYEAVKEGLSVTICPAASITATTCDTSSTAYSEGWIVLSNALSGTSGTANVLRRQPPFASFGSTDTLNTSASAANSAVVFNREGFASGLTGILTFTLHDSNSAVSYTRCLVLGVSGVMQTGLASSMSSASSILGATCS